MLNFKGGGGKIPKFGRVLFDRHCLYNDDYNDGWMKKKLESQHNSEPFFETQCGYGMLFTALQGMQTRSSDGNSVRPSVRLSARHTREL